MAHSTERMVNAGFFLILCSDSCVRLSSLLLTSSSSFLSSFKILIDVPSGIIEQRTTGILFREKLELDPGRKQYLDGGSGQSVPYLP